MWPSLGSWNSCWNESQAQGLGKVMFKRVWDPFCAAWEDKSRCVVFISWEMVRLKQVVPPELELLQAGSEAEEQPECPVQTIQIITQIRGFCFHSAL